MVTPLPPQSGHTERVCMLPKNVRCTVTTWPVPWHVGQLIVSPPSAQPLPPHDLQGARRL